MLTVRTALHKYRFFCKLDLCLSVRHHVGKVIQKPEVKQLPSYRTRSAKLPRSEPLPTTTGHYTICSKKKPQSCAPEDGQKFARNMMSLSWRSIKLLLLISRWFLYYLT